MINNYSIPGRSLFQWHLQGNRSAAQNTDDISDQIRSAEMVHHNSAVVHIVLQFYSKGHLIDIEHDRMVGGKDLFLIRVCFDIHILRDVPRLAFQVFFIFLLWKYLKTTEY